MRQPNLNDLKLFPNSPARMTALSLGGYTIDLLVNVNIIVLSLLSDFDENGARQAKSQAKGLKKYYNNAGAEAAARAPVLDDLDVGESVKTALQGAAYAVDTLADRNEINTVKAETGLSEVNATDVVEQAIAILPFYQAEEPAEDGGGGGEEGGDFSLAPRPASVRVQRIYVLMGKKWGWVDGIEGRY